MQPTARKAPPPHAKEVGMQHAFSRIGAVGLIVVFTVCAFSRRAAAENKQLTLHAKHPPDPYSKSVMTPGDVSNHEVVQQVHYVEITSPEPDFNGFKAINYDQLDSVAGTGTHRGYEMYPL